MKLSARNKLAGTITAVDKGAVNATVQIDLGGGAAVTAMITNASVEELGLEAEVLTETDYGRAQTEAARTLRRALGAPFLSRRSRWTGAQ